MQIVQGQGLQMLQLQSYSVVLFLICYKMHVTLVYYPGSCCNPLS